MHRLQTDQQILAHIESRTMPVPECACIVWMGPTYKGYGKIQVHGRSRPVHRVAYELAKGPVPAGLVLDHKCRVRSCCNPDHLEPVTNKTNVLRGVGRTAVNAAKTHCKRGHPLIEGNLRLSHIKKGQRCCLICHRFDNNRANRHLRQRSVQS